MLLAQDSFFLAIARSNDCASEIVEGGAGVLFIVIYSGDIMNFQTVPETMAGASETF